MNSRNLDWVIKENLRVAAGSLAQLRVFLAVAEKRSFTGAARLLGVSPSAVSQAVARLEQELGAALLVRTTRSVNLTELGSHLVSETGPAIASALSALAAANTKSHEPSGVLRLNVPRLACRVALRPVIAAYARDYPAVRIELTVDDRNVDIVREGYDAGIRLREAIEKDMVSVRLSPPIRFVVVGSKPYLAKRGEPRHPRDLVDHACLGWQSPTTGVTYRWEFEQRKRAFEIGVAGPIVSNDADVLIACAEQHLGLTYVAEHEVRSELVSGRLQTVLESFCPVVPGLFLYYPQAAQRVPKLAAFVACVRATLARSADRAS